MRPIPRHPCPRCGEPAPALVENPARRVKFVMCRACGARGREQATFEAAVEAWDASAEAAARRAEGRARTGLRRGAHALRRDPGFVAAVLDAHDGHEGSDGGVHGFAGQAFRLAVGGRPTYVNARAFVDMALAPRWPALATVKNPEAVVHYVLHDNGLGLFDVEGRRATGEQAGAWRRSEPVIGHPVGAVAAAAEPS